MIPCPTNGRRAFGRANLKYNVRLSAGLFGGNDQAELSFVSFATHSGALPKMVKKFS
jgi:hypothetical protein